MNTNTLILTGAALLLASCTGPTIAEKPKDDMDRRAASMDYGENADVIRPSKDLESLSEKSLREYDGTISAALLQDYLHSVNKKR